MYRAEFLNGHQCQKLPVYLEIEGKSLFIMHAEHHYPLDSWPLKELVLRSPKKDLQPLEVTHPDKGLACLFIREADCFYWINNNCPGLLKRHEYEGENKRTVKLSALSLCLLVMAYLAYPVVVQSVTYLIAIETENRLFNTVHYDILQEMGTAKVCVSQDGQKILKQMAARLWGGPLQGEISIQVVKNSKVNAFATPGNHVVIYSGLLNKAHSSSELAGVLAHELGHVHHRHAFQAMIETSGLHILSWFLGGATSLDFISTLASQSYSRDHEREADEFALAALQQANVTPKGLIRFFEQLAQDEGHLDRLLLFMSTHPLSGDRAERLVTEFGGEEPLDEQEWRVLKDICSQTRHISDLKMRTVP